MTPFLKAGKTAGAVFIIIIIGLLSIVITLARLPLENLFDKNFKAQITPFSINFYKDDSDEVVFKVSPFDDYYYQSSFKHHIEDKSIYLQNQGLLDKLINLLSRMVNNKKLIWSMEGSKARITYTVFSKNGSLELVRQVHTLGIKVDAIGQSIVFCQTCMVTDEEKRVYFKASLLTQDKVDTAERLKLTPFIIENKMPYRLSKLNIVDLDGNIKATILITSYQEIFFEEQWQLLELKTFVNKTKPITVSQIIIL